LYLGTTTCGIVEKRAEFTAVGLDIDSTFHGPWIAFADIDLVCWPTPFLNGVHRARVLGELGPAFGRREIR
jgi:hypothetical protein